MTNLECSVKNCCHNQDNCCCKQTIIVEGEHATRKNMTCCGSFDSSIDHPRNSTETPRHSLTVECDAINCRYNENRKCNATKIDINGGGTTHSADGTNCATFEIR